eukprot:c27292_g1_i1 orf=306-1733(+)
MIEFRLASMFCPRPATVFTFDCTYERLVRLLHMVSEPASASEMSELVSVAGSIADLESTRATDDLLTGEHGLNEEGGTGDGSELDERDKELTGVGMELFSSKRLKTEAPLSRTEKAWKHWRSLGEPKCIVAPMVDQSELPFRMLCRKYGANGAYTPMLHSRLFAENAKYRSSEFTTCPEDRPLFVQFCANNADTLLTAARIVEQHCDYIDINLGCPQRIAKRGNYGAFLMDNLPLVQSLVQKLASNLTIPVSCKIRIFPNLDDTINYAHMLEKAGCSLLAVHGRTRDQKDSKSVRADWSAIKAVKAAVNIPVLANGNIQSMDDVHDCLRETGADGVLSAESLLENPALFAGYSTCDVELQAHFSKGLLKQSCEATFGHLDQPMLLLEYLDLCEKFPVHVHRMLGNCFRIHTDLREKLNRESKLSLEFLKGLICSLVDRNTRMPVPQHYSECLPLSTLVGSSGLHKTAACSLETLE